MFTHENLPYVMYPFFYGNPFYLGQARFVVEGFVAALAVYALYCWWKDSKIQGNEVQRKLKISKSLSH
jgi:hypothetical protein